jgi:hypothetical protein
MVGLKPDQRSDGGLHGFDYDGAVFFARGLYIDVLLLATLQRLGLDGFSLDLNRLYAQRPSPFGLEEVEAALGEFRTYVWRQDFAPQGSQDEVLSGLQTLQRLPTREADVSRNLAELSSQVSRREQTQVGNLLRALTIIGVLWGFIWTALDEWTVSWRGWALLTAAIMIALIIFLHRGLANAIGFRRRPPGETTALAHMDWGSLD